MGYFLQVERNLTLKILCIASSPSAPFTSVFFAAPRPHFSRLRGDADLPTAGEFQRCAPARGSSGSEGEALRLGTGAKDRRVEAEMGGEATSGVPAETKHMAADVRDENAIVIYISYHSCTWCARLVSAEKDRTVVHVHNCAYII